jgi:hypothetical protein
MSYQNFNKIIVEKNEEAGKTITRHPNLVEKQIIIDSNLELGRKSSVVIDDFNRLPIYSKILTVVIELIKFILLIVRIILINIFSFFFSFVSKKK